MYCRTRTVPGLVYCTGTLSSSTSFQCNSYQYLTATKKFARDYCTYGHSVLVLVLGPCHIPSLYYRVQPDHHYRREPDTSSTCEITVHVIDSFFRHNSSPRQENQSTSASYHMTRRLCRTEARASTLKLRNSNLTSNSHHGSSHHLPRLKIPLPHSPATPAHRPPQSCTSQTPHTTLHHESQTDNVCMRIQDFPSPPSIILYGLEATGKSLLTKALLDVSETTYSWVACHECITARHLTERIASQVKDAVREKECVQLDKNVLGMRAENVNALAVVLGKILGTRGKEGDGDGGDNDVERKHVLVLDRIDRQREATPILLAGLARLGEIVRPYLIHIFAPDANHHRNHRSPA